MTADSIVFVWRGTDRNGQPSAGEEMASSAAMARAQLRKQGITTKTVRKKAKELTLFGPKK
ncbi:type II secretion system F family protein, partial [Luminiphilus sp.]|nr:type II secretion system F family protein [Luminiphilus sp.]